jgi:hypothetical protein
MLHKLKAEHWRKKYMELYDILDRMNAHMWESFMIKDRRWTRADGVKIMNLLEEWASKH